MRDRGRPRRDLRPLASSPIPGGILPSSYRNRIVSDGKFHGIRISRIDSRGETRLRKFLPSVEEAKPLKRVRAVYYGYCKLAWIESKIKVRRRLNLFEGREEEGKSLDDARFYLLSTGSGGRIALRFLRLK